jgi:hypothetical protein
VYRELSPALVLAAAGGERVEWKVRAKMEKRGPTPHHPSSHPILVFCSSPTLCPRKTAIPGLVPGLLGL